MNKSAIIYDKWLHSLGGGEVVACNMAKILKDSGYDVTFIGGKKVSIKAIKDKLGIDLTGINFTEIWNDELRLKDFTQDKDLFINLTFIDYSQGFAKKNIYFTHFPSKTYNNIRGFIDINFVYPFLIKVLRPIEFLSKPKSITMVHNRLMYTLEEPIDIAFSFLDNRKIYRIRFSIFFESFFKLIFQSFSWKIQSAQIISQQIKVDHHFNVVHYYINIKPNYSTVKLHLELDKHFVKTFYYNRVYLLYPRALPTYPVFSYFFKKIYERINNKLRTGLFVNVLRRLNTYQVVLANSKFTKYFIKKYWKKNSTILYPPVELLFNKYRLNNIKKNDWITSVGRFFTLGHGKKQEVLIEAFKRLYNMGYRDWQLHLIGGVGDESSSTAFVKKIQEEAKNYPIYFHFNPEREEVEQILLHSKIYWHATGFGENEKKNPIKFEHFGIAPIEAIGAKNIPILYNGGGLKEIISTLNLDAKLNLFNSVDDLINNTVYFINLKKTLPWNNIFQSLEDNFSQEHFRYSFLKIINRLVHQCFIR